MVVWQGLLYSLPHTAGISGTDCVGLIMPLEALLAPLARGQELLLAASFVGWVNKEWVG